MQWHQRWNLLLCEEVIQVSVLLECAWQVGRDRTYDLTIKSATACCCVLSYSTVPILEYHPKMEMSLVYRRKNIVHTYSSGHTTQNQWYQPTWSARLWRTLSKPFGQRRSRWRWPKISVLMGWSTWLQVWNAEAWTTHDVDEDSRKGEWANKAQHCGVEEPIMNDSATKEITCPMAELVTASDCYWNRKVVSSSLTGAA